MAIMIVLVVMIFMSGMFYTNNVDDDDGYDYCLCLEISHYIAFKTYMH